MLSNLNEFITTNTSSLEEYNSLTRLAALISGAKISLITVIDEEGVSRKCFFEEIPSSFTGLESVTITNPGFGYTSTPTVTVVASGATKACLSSSGL